MKNQQIHFPKFMREIWSAADKKVLEIKKDGTKEALERHQARVDELLKLKNGHNN
jgi:hypothetical protein